MFPEKREFSAIEKLFVFHTRFSAKAVFLSKTRPIFENIQPDIIKIVYDENQRNGVFEDLYRNF